MSVKQPWHNIFAASKIVVSMSPRNLFNPNVMIRFADSNFLDIFQVEPTDATSTSGKAFSVLFGEGTIRANWQRIEMAILTGKSHDEFINFYTANKIPLSCHVHVNCLSQSPPSSGLEGGDAASTSRSNHSRSTDLEKWAVVTIRSASVVGNATCSGVGILGLDHVDKETLSTAVLPRATKVGGGDRVGAGAGPM